MEVKAEQYVRFKDNTIHLVSKVIGLIEFCYDMKKTSWGSSSRITTVDKIDKVADDPRDLIEVGDLVKFKSNKETYRFIENETQIQVYKDGWIMNNITEIWTKTSEDTFTRQWSDDE